MSTVEKLHRSENVSDLIEANVSLIDDVFNDSRMSPAEKMKSFNLGTRSFVRLKRVQLETAKVYAKLGLKIDGDINSLTLMPAEKDTSTQ